jgi:hypothetical protein
MAPDGVGFLTLKLIFSLALLQGLTAMLSPFSSHKRNTGAAGVGILMSVSPHLLHPLVQDTVVQGLWSSWPPFP